MPLGRKKVLFVSEAVTLAHAARPLALSAALDSSTYDIGFASDPRCSWLLRDYPGRFLPLWSIDSGRFLDALSRGKPLYDDKVLHRYVRDDLELLDEFKPSVVVGDFRLSLSISARLRKVPYLTISNCYWSPYWRPQRYIVPNIRPLTGFLPLPVANGLFQLGRPIAFALHCGPINRVRRSYGMKSLGLDLRHVYTDADYVLYADAAELFPDAKLPAHHRFIGPLIWSPPVPFPQWWEQIPVDRPVVYLTLGSSGQAELLPEILSSLAPLPITVIAATAGAKLPAHVPPNARVSEYLPGADAARRARLVICNGGSPTSHQGLAVGTPIIGIASNLDQFLNMDAVKHAGAGELIRADRFNGRTLSTLVTGMLKESRHASAANTIAASIGRYDGTAQFRRMIASLTSVTGGTAASCPTHHDR